jgi:hypothetical protein
MKKNYIVFFTTVLALTALCAFWGCSSSDDDDGPSPLQAEEAGLGKEITLTPTQGVQVYKMEDGSPFTPPTGEVTVRPRSSKFNSNYAAAVEAVSRITSTGMLTLKLPEYTYWGDYTDDLLAEEGITADPPDVKIARVDNFKATTGGFRLDNNSINTTNGESWRGVSYIYADKDAIVTGVYEDQNGEGMPVSFYVNLILKEGWNSIIQSLSGSNATVVTHIPGAGYRWEAYAD